MKTISILKYSPGFRASRRFIQAIALSIAMSMLCSAARPNSSPATDSQPAGIISISGNVRINGQNALPGQTLFAQSHVITFAGSESLIVLSNSARLSLSANTEVTVDSSGTSVTMNLLRGRIVSSGPTGVFVDFTTSDLAIKTDATEPVVFSAETTECEGTFISVTAGHLEIRRAGLPVTIKAGESFSTIGGSTAPRPGQPSLSRKRSIGLFVGIGAAIALMLAVALGDNDEDQQNPGDFGGCIIVPSPGSPNTCP